MKIKLENSLSCDAVGHLIKTLALFQDIEKIDLSIDDEKFESFRDALEYNNVYLFISDGKCIIKEGSQLTIDERSEIIARQLITGKRVFVKRNDEPPRFTIGFEYKTDIPDILCPEDEEISIAEAIKLAKDDNLDNKKMILRTLGHISSFKENNE